MEFDLVGIKQRFGIIGYDPALDYAIHIAVQVAATDLSVLISGESGVGKETFPKIIHEFSPLKHGPYIAVNCGAIPEGTIDSELFGHEKGSFTGATETRKGYFEVADGGTIFLDEVADLPLGTQVRLLRVLENREFIKVGTSTVQKTKVRVVAASNVNIIDRISKGKFREDLYYRLNTVPIHIPPLRERKDDIYLLFRKFASDFAEKYHFPQLELTPEAVEELKNFKWPGNIRQLKNITEQMSLIEKNRLINEVTLSNYLVTKNISSVPMLLQGDNEKSEHFERELVFKFLADMKREVTELKSIVNQIVKGDIHTPDIQHSYLDEIKAADSKIPYHITDSPQYSYPTHHPLDEQFADSIVLDDNFSLIESEKEFIKKALEKHGNKRKMAADELGISERTLYRKIKEYGL
jgi:transcriptional regulator with PAS, ATPase and Fis domain